MKKTILKVSGMHCKSCEMLIQDSLEENGVKASLDYKKGNATIEYDEKKIDEKKIKKIIEAQGYKVN